MISLIYGAKGSGKTKEILRRANEALDVSKGNIVYRHNGYVDGAEEELIEKVRELIAQ